jgi:arabinogalactan endo-1,4-beta-galactosidase
MRSVCEITKQELIADVPEPGFRKYWRQKLSSLKSQYRDITNKYPEAASVVQQVYKVLRDIEILSRHTPAEMGEALNGRLL